MTCPTCGEWGSEYQDQECKRCIKMYNEHPEVYEWVRDVIRHKIEEADTNHTYKYSHKLSDY